jgi:carbamate kinase
VYKVNLSQIETQVKAIKQELQTIGKMRPGSLTVQYRVPKKKIGPFYQISYTHKMQSRTNYVRPQFVKRLKKEIKTYKRFKYLVEKWVELAIKQSQLVMKVDIMKEKKVS